jgi:hypothetical protein
MGLSSLNIASIPTDPEELRKFTIAFSESRSRISASLSLTHARTVNGANPLICVSASSSFAMPLYSR